MMNSPLDYDCPACGAAPGRRCVVAVAYESQTLDHKTGRTSGGVPLVVPVYVPKLAPHIKRVDGCLIEQMTDPTSGIRIPGTRREWQALEIKPPSTAR